MSLIDRISALITTIKGAFDALDGRVADLEASPPGSVSIDTVEVNFTTASPARFFTATVTGAAVGQDILAVVSLDMPAGVQEDELEADPLVCSARVTAVNTVRILVASATGAPIIGKRNINLIRG
jgi:hypothetical protein